MGWRRTGPRGQEDALVGNVPQTDSRVPEAAAGLSVRGEECGSVGAAEREWELALPPW